jgi:ATP-dependent Lon protease
MQNYVNYKNQMPKEQRECCSGSKGCKDQLHIFIAVLQECKSRRKALCMACTDYQKVLDSVSLSWLIKSLELIGINNKMIPFTKKTLNYWKGSMRLYTDLKLIQRKLQKYNLEYFKDTRYHHFSFALP